MQNFTPMRKIQILILSMMLTTSFNTLFAQKYERVGSEYSGVQLAKDESGNSYFINKNDYAIIASDSITLNADIVVKEIQKSSMDAPDKELCKRIVLMKPTNEGKIRALKDMGKGFKVVNEIMMKQYYLGLQEYFGEKKLKKLLKKKK